MLAIANLPFKEHHLEKNDPVYVCIYPFKVSYISDDNILGAMINDYAM